VITDFYAYLGKPNYFSDLYVIDCGAYNCKPNESMGESIRDSMIIHYIRKGSGTFVCNGKSQTVSEGQTFVIFPDVRNQYIASKDDPWKYIWIVLKGNLVNNISKYGMISTVNPVITSSQIGLCLVQLQELLESHKMPIKGIFEYSLGLAYIVLSELAGVEIKYISQNQNVNKAVDYIENRFADKINISEIASYVGIDSKYLCSIFRKNTGKTPYQYILDLRMKRACKLLSNNDCSIEVVAYSVGYTDKFAFSRIFKKHTGICPTDYRKKHPLLIE